MTDRLVRDGRVAVLVSPDFGAGWSTWCMGPAELCQQMLFDPWLADLMLSENFSREQKIERATAHCLLRYPDVYLGGLKDLTVVWVPQGQAFRITEYDGQETVELRDNLNWIMA